MKREITAALTTDIDRRCLGKPEIAKAVYGAIISGKSITSETQ